MYRALFTIAALFALLALSGCTLALNLSCSDDDDCATGTCDEEGICVTDSALIPCTTSEECEDAFGPTGVCQDGFCEDVSGFTGGPCQRLEGFVDDDDAFRIGVVLQLSGVGAGFGVPMLNAIILAMDGVNGIGGVDGRRLGLIVCDTEGRDSIATEAAQHLVDTDGVTAIIGMNSSQVIDIGPTVVTPNDVLLISPSATAATISGLGEDLIWRTAPSDENQAIAMSELIDYLVADHLPAMGIAEPKVTLLVRNHDRWATGLRDHLSANLPAEILGGGTDRFSIHNFPNVGAGDPADYTGTAADIAAEAVNPHLVVVLGSADSWTIIDHIHTLLEDDELLFVGGDAMKNAEEAGQANPELEGRIWGTGPRNVAEIDYEPYSIFRLQFQSEFGNPDNFQFVANAFDALYVLAFAAAAEGFTGPELAEGLTRLSDGQDIDPRATAAQEGIAILRDGGTINYRGASGPLNFDANGDPEPLPIALWCFRDGAVPEEGPLYDEAAGFTVQTCVDPPDGNGGDDNGD